MNCLRTIYIKHSRRERESSHFQDLNSICELKCECRKDLWKKKIAGVNLRQQIRRCYQLRPVEKANPTATLTNYEPPIPARTSHTLSQLILTPISQISNLRLAWKLQTLPVPMLSSYQYPALHWQAVGTEYIEAAYNLKIYMLREVNKLAQEHLSSKQQNTGCELRSFYLKTNALPTIPYFF